jgi:hypothetical protein
MSNLPAAVASAGGAGALEEGVSTMSPSRSPLPLIAVAIAGCLLLAVSPLYAQVAPIEPSDYSGGPGIGPIGPPAPSEELTTSTASTGSMTRMSGESGTSEPTPSSGSRRRSS